VRLLKKKKWGGEKKGKGSQGDGKKGRSKKERRRNYGLKEISSPHVFRIEKEEKSEKRGVFSNSKLKVRMMGQIEQKGQRREWKRSPSQILVSERGKMGNTKKKEKERKAEKRKIETEGKSI